MRLFSRWPPRVSATTLRRFNLIATFGWLGLMAPTLLLWLHSVPWIVTMSWYANFVGHLSSWQAARAEEMADPALPTAGVAPQRRRRSSAHPGCYRSAGQLRRLRSRAGRTTRTGEYT